LEAVLRPVLIAVVLLAWAASSQYDARSGRFPWSNYAISLGVMSAATAIVIALQVLRKRTYSWGDAFWTLIGIAMLLMLIVSLVRYTLGLA